jgi:RHS repeat-associated protein
MLANFAYAYDLVGNPTQIEDTAPAADWREEVWPQRMRAVGYDDLYRVTSVAYSYNTPSGGASFRSPFHVENNAGDTRPVPLQTQLPSRIRSEAFTYDFLGNVTSSTDDLNAAYDRSLGAITNGYGTGWGPNQLTAGNGVRARYDLAGNLAELKVERAGACPSGTGGKCAQWFAYDWDEVGQLARARRWDYDAALPVLVPGNLPEDAPAWDLHYAYSGGARVVKSATDSTGVERHTLAIFDTLRLDHDKFLVAAGDYERHRDHTHVYLAGGVGHVFYDGGTLPRPPSAHETRLFLNIGDHLGSTSVTIDYITSEVVERATFQSYGAIESDYRPNRWHNAREPYKFTGKEEDIEVGATYFGARYYQPHLGRFMSADPLTIHGGGGDLNPYAYVGGRVMSHVDPLGLDGQGSAGSSTSPDAGDPPPNSIPPAGESWQMGPAVPFLWSLGQQDDGPFGAELPLDLDPSNPLNPWHSHVSSSAGGVGAVPQRLPDVVQVPGPMPPGWQPSIAEDVLFACRGSCPVDAWARHNVTNALDDLIQDIAWAFILEGAGKVLRGSGRGPLPAVSPVSFGAGSASSMEFVSKVVNTNMGHAAERAVERAGFASTKEGRVALQKFGVELKSQGVLPEEAIFDPAHANRVIIPGFGQGGAVVYQVDKNGVYTLKTVLRWRPR